MCTNGINTDQFESNIEQIDEILVLSRRWIHRDFHQVEAANYLKTAAKLREAQSLLDDVRALLTDARDNLENEAALANVTVQAI
ncbi:MAG: dynein gamma chain protein [Actinomycetia bacterium]|nr:dynein gamma chain protein [Actinomycetes bacterium]